MRLSNMLSIPSISVVTTNGLAKGQNLLDPLNEIRFGIKSTLWYQKRNLVRAKTI